VLFCVAALVGYRVLTRTIHTCLLAVLGPEASVDGVEVGLRHVTVNNLRITRKGVSAPLTVHRIVVTPSLRSLPTGQIRLSSVELERPAAAITLHPNGSVELPCRCRPRELGRRGEARDLRWRYRRFASMTA